jgi:hypothetical protein
MDKQTLDILLGWLWSCTNPVQVLNLEKFVHNRFKDRNYMAQRRLHRFASECDEMLSDLYFN